ncbi:MAG: SIMPL domain-containing protein [Wenzhouxiangellaceae bacterium]|nr:SIMPL domain-containing protein [Wenzhouxiangellaceae bacterium]
MSDKRSSDPMGALAIALVVAAIILSYGLGSAMDRFVQRDRAVEVKGLAERELAADLAVWPIGHNVTADTLASLRERLERADEAIVAFLKLNGFTGAEITANPPSVTDRWMHASPGNRPAERYMAERTLTLRSGKVDALRQAMAGAAELLGQGVALTPNWGNAADFLFTGLEGIKPEMIAEATADARRAAAQFAEDSGSEVGAIRRARQGYFTIENLDPSSPHVKRVRVVTTIEYALED